MKPIPFTAVLLAGGKSTRMGFDKAALVVDGTPLWRRQLATLQATHPHELLISGRPDGPYAGCGIDVIVDGMPGLGPLGGLAAALRRSSCEMLLLLAIDLPYITVGFLSSLVHEATSRGRGVVARYERFEPLAAVYSRACLPLAEQHLNDPDRSMQRFIREAVQRGLLVEHPLAEAERRDFVNLNTAGDWRAATA